LIYNQHTNERKPFLEISNSKSISAAYSFGYITNSKGAGSAKSDPVVDSVDNITDGYYNKSVQVVRRANSYLTLKDSYLAASAKDLAYSGSKDSSVMFKVKEAADHGRYAFLGWIYGSTSLTEDGGVLLNKTLKWLKYGDAAFGGQNDDPARKGNIALICNKADCKQGNEMNMIKYLRSNGYSVVGKELGKWNALELNDYDLIVCSDSKACGIKLGSAIYSAHIDSGKAFLEIPNNGGTTAAEAFGYVHSKSYKKLGYAIIPQGADTIFSGFKGYMEVLSGKASIAGPNANDLNSAVNLANIPGSGTSSTSSSRSTSSTSDTSAMFVSAAAGNKGRYAYVGWVPDVNNLNENGRKLLLRTIDWLICGDACLQDFSTTFGDMSLKFDVYSPVEKDYNISSIYINVTANQRLKEIRYSFNGGKDTILCKDCNGVYKRLKVKEGQNQLKFTLLDYTGESHEKVINFFVDSKKPKISRIYPSGKYISSIVNFEIKYTEDYLKSITLFYGTSEPLESKELAGCFSGKNRVCRIQVDLTQFSGKQIKYYFVVEDRTHQEVSRPQYATVL
jgi:hypothetical protein